MADLTKEDRQRIAEILCRRANEVAAFVDDYRRDGKHHGSVELALTREVERLRSLAEKVNPPEPDGEEDGDA
jgi:hypothetical protein